MGQPGGQYPVQYPGPQYGGVRPVAPSQPSYYTYNKAGKPIPNYAPRPPPAYSVPNSPADRRYPPAQYGRPPVYASQVAPTYANVPVTNPALALDAADGVIDGRYFGAPIAAPTYVANAPFAPTYAAPAAAAWAPTYVSPAVAPAPILPATHPAYYPAPPMNPWAYGPPMGSWGYGSPYGPPMAPWGYGTPFAPPVAPWASPYGNPYANPYAPQANPLGANAAYGAYDRQALAVDAADGVIDGKYFGSTVTPGGGVAAGVTPSAYAQMAAGYSNQYAPQTFAPSADQSAH